MNPNVSQKLKELLGFLKKEGFSDEDIQKIVEQAAQFVSLKFDAEMKAALTEEDFKRIDECDSQEEANVMMRELFGLRTGKSANEVLVEMYDNFSDGFLKEYREKKGK